MSSLTFYGGVNEIGGNKILLETSDGIVLLDFGRRMGLASKYYAEFLQIRSKNALRDLMRLGLLPPLRARNQRAQGVGLLDEGEFSPTGIDYRSYSEALETVYSIYERLFLGKSLKDGCDKCPLIEEVSKLQSHTRGLIQESIEKELGYYLHVEKAEES